MKTSLKRATLLFLVQDNQILLAMKKRGFGAGKWNGVGGKPEGSESILQTAIRECVEEINVTPIKLQQVATLNFYFPDDKFDWNQQVSVYLCSKWNGEPTETDEMKPKWYNLNNIPYESMWSDDAYWLPEVLKGNSVEAEFLFDDDNGVVTYQICLV